MTQSDKTTVLYLAENDRLIAVYTKTYHEASDALKKAEIYDLMGSLAGYLRTEDRTIVPAGFTTVKVPDATKDFFTPPGQVS